MTPDSVTTTTALPETTTSAPYESPSGMNIVLLGYDLRAEGSSEVTEGRSDVIILVHIDPEKGFLSLLSVPRDLRVEVEGYGHRKINAAYAYGGGALLIRTIQDRLGVDLDHYIAVNLEAFKAITDSLGGVYVDVDRGYDDGKTRLRTRLPTARRAERRALRPHPARPEHRLRPQGPAAAVSSRRSASR